MKVTSQEIYFKFFKQFFFQESASLHKMINMDFELSKEVDSTFVVLIFSHAQNNYPV